ncbi:G-protein coupled receptor 26 isoform X2 [Austrofundulus limnaeus]|uniref:G-protein coupled receptor 26 isoform X2 n=1 Tax=Austrofundulus limnaeus TaxID=52670 RepID=A0A2I4B411_AUSLI|nr:PREDICTED: G-protein coupled receptor 26-like isoform X2 [Austrofundulus limnaeus]
MDTAEVILSLLVVVIIIVSLLSNVLVLICFAYNPEIRKQVPCLFNLNLTFCNLLLTVSNMPLTLAGLVREAQPAGDGFCRLLGFLETFLSTNSMLSMAALSIDRWIAVVFPLRYHSKMRHKDAALVLGYTWAHSVSFSTAAACLSWVGYHRLYASCTLSSPGAGSRTQFVIFTVFFHSFTFLLSFVVLCFTYLKVLKVARFHCKRIDVITMQTLVLLVDIHPRIVELFPAVPINPHWGIVSKCLAYSKAACDPFVYSLLRHQYKQTCTDIVNKLLKRSPLNASGRMAQPENQGSSLPTAE